jgi:NAD(P)-dependent dehydrogenase (short-subunit alcohol dehydrogenase family)
LAPMQSSARTSASQQLGELTGRVALVTGGGSGIGLAIVRRFVREGALVAVLDCASMEDVRQEIDQVGCGQQLLTVPCDITREQDVVAAVESICKHFGRLDIAVNNAGVAVSVPFEELTLEQWNRVMAVNCTGSFLVSREAVRAFLRQGSGGVLVFINSDDSLKPSRHFTAYNASKAAILHLARTIANELGPRQIRANSILPGAVLVGSGMWTAELREARARIHGFDAARLEEEYKKNNALGVIIDPTEIAELAVFLASDRSAKMTGNALVIDGGGLGGYVR